MSFIQKILSWILIVIIIITGIIVFQEPSLERDWSPDQKILSNISFTWEEVNIQNIRNFSYNTPDDYIASYYDQTFNLNTVESLYYIIEPFSNIDGPAHTMLSFGFSDGSFVTISSEIRKEKWESFSPLKWLLNQYEIVYIIWSEHDLVKLRANYRKNEVIMYPIKSSQENIKQLFISMLKRADQLSKEPEFYNTLTNTCTTSILDHLNELRENNNKDIVNWSKQIFLPSYSDEIAYNLWLIDTRLSLENAREYYKINTLSEEFSESSDYSRLIRKERK